MSRAALAAVVGVAALAICAVVFAVSGPGSSGERRAGTGSLTWESRPRIFTADTLPDDRVLTGTVRNDSLADVEVAAADLVLVDRRGRRVEHRAIFARGFADVSYSPRLQAAVPEADRVRLGIELDLGPGEARALTVAWRVTDPDRAPVRIELPQGSLDLPRG